MRLDADTTVRRWVCNRGHPHPTRDGSLASETARADGATDAQLTALLEAEVTEFNA